MPTHTGKCHCGVVKFSFVAPEQLDVTLCNCSICAHTAYEHVFIPHTDFTLLSGDEALSEYRFGSGQARHLFCRHCGVKSFYQPRSHPDCYSINFNAITPPTLKKGRFIEFNGQEW